MNPSCDPRGGSCISSSFPDHTSLETGVIYFCLWLRMQCLANRRSFIVEWMIEWQSLVWVFVKSMRTWETKHGNSKGCTLDSKETIKIPSNSIESSWRNRMSHLLKSLSVLFWQPNFPPTIPCSRPVRQVSQFSGFDWPAMISLFGNIRAFPLLATPPQGLARPVSHSRLAPPVSEAKLPPLPSPTSCPRPHYPVPISGPERHLFPPMRA